MCFSCPVFTSLGCVYVSWHAVYNMQTVCGATEPKFKNMA